jgi:hypothetical protein
MPSSRYSVIAWWGRRLACHLIPFAHCSELGNKQEEALQMRLRTKADDFGLVASPSALASSPRLRSDRRLSRAQNKSRLRPGQLDKHRVA